MTQKILIVDDDPNVLKAYERRLRRRFSIETALCSEEGVTAVNFLGPFAVVISDMMMPRENGADFLARILDTSPDSVRIMLTGNADQDTAAAAINKGRVFKFLNKPCGAEQLEQAIQEGIQEYERLKADREMLSQTVLGAVDLMSKVLALASPEAFSRGGRLKMLVSEIAAAAGWEDAWRHEAIALLSQVGCVAAPAEALRKHAAGDELTTAEQDSLDRVPEVSAELISSVPRLEPLAEVIRRLDDDVSADDADASVDIDGPRTSLRFSVWLLRLVGDFDDLVHRAHLGRLEAVKQLRENGRDYFPECVDALQKAVNLHEQKVLGAVNVDALADGMQLVADVTTTDGALLVTKGQDVTPSLRHRLANYASTHKVCEPIDVLVPNDLAKKLGLVTAAAAH